MDFLTMEFYNNTVVNWSISLGIIAGALILAKIVYVFFGKFVKRAASKTKTKLDDILVDMLEEPVVTLLVVVSVWFAFNRLTLSESVSLWVSNFYWIMVALNVTWFISRFVDALVEEYLVPLAKSSDNDFDDQIVPIIRKVINLTIWALGIIVAANNAGYDITALLAGLGIGGLALAMASKDTVANIFGGITIFADKPFKINDRVKINGYDGTITEIGIRSTRLKTLENRIVTIPNSKFTDGMVENVSSEPSRKVVLNLGLVYDTPAHKLQGGMKYLRDLVKVSDNLEENSVVSFNEFGDSALGILFIYYIKKGADIMDTQTDINLDIKLKFEELELDMAFPTQTIYNINEK